MAKEDNNAVQLEQIKLDLLCREILKKTEKCALTWAQTSATPTHFSAVSFSDYEHWTFLLSRTANNTASGNSFTLDILKQGQPFLTVSSDDFDVVEEIYDVVLDINKGTGKKIDAVSSFLDGLTDCSDPPLTVAILAFVHPYDDNTASSGFTAGTNLDFVASISGTKAAGNVTVTYVVTLPNLTTQTPIVHTNSNTGNPRVLIDVYENWNFNQNGTYKVTVTVTDTASATATAEWIYTQS